MAKISFKTVLFAALVSQAIFFVGCASKPTVNAKQTRNYYVPEFYTVKSGDSLSLIAARYGLNYMDIAQLNNIQAVDKIYVNQSLRLRGSGANTPRLVQTRPIEQAPPIQRQTITQQAQQASVPNTVRPVTPVPQQPQVGLGATVPVVPVVQTPAVSSTGQLKWVMPSQGRIIDRFDLGQDKKGVRFAGNIGDPVYAAAAGKVVYADDGLKEYGKLVLLSHNDGYITAYAHNSKLLVKSGDQIAAGQKIAEMGNTGTTSTMLEFQVRLEGKPIDPSVVLPIN